MRRSPLPIVVVAPAARNLEKGHLPAECRLVGQQAPLAATLIRGGAIDGLTGLGNRCSIP